MIQKGRNSREHLLWNAGNGYPTQGVTRGRSIYTRIIANNKKYERKQCGHERENP